MKRNKCSSINWKKHFALINNSHNEIQLLCYIDSYQEKKIHGVNNEIIAVYTKAVFTFFSVYLRCCRNSNDTIEKYSSIAI